MKKWAVREYQQEFERLSTHVRGWPEKALLGAFIRGEVQMFKPRSLRHAIELARMRDDQMQRQKEMVKTTNIMVPTADSQQSDNVSPPIRNITWSEMQ